MGAHNHLYRKGRWVRIRKHQLLHEPLCTACRALGKAVPATVADHVVPHKGDERLFWEGKLQSMCKPCHDA